MKLKYVLVIIFLILGFYLRHKIASSTDFWQDESMSFAIANQTSFKSLFFQDSSYSDIHHPPYYYWLLKKWLVFFPSSVISIRFLTLIFYPLTFFVLYVLGKKHFSPAVGTLSVAFFATHPLMVNLGFQARMYAITIFFATVGLYFFLNLSKPTKASLWWTAFFFSLAIYFDYMALWILPTIGFFICLSLLQKNLRLALNYFKVMAAILILTSFQVANLLYDLLTVRYFGPGSIPWDEFGLQWCLLQLTKTLGVFSVDWTIFPLLIAIFVCILVTKLLLDRQSVKTSQLRFFFIFYLLSPILVSWLIMPMFLARNVAFASILLIIILAEKLAPKTGTKWRHGKLLIAFLILASFTSSSYRWQGFEFDAGLQNVAQAVVKSQSTLYLLPGESREVYEGYYFHLWSLPKEQIVEVNQENIGAVMGSKTANKYFLLPSECEDNEICSPIMKTVIDYCQNNSTCQIRTR